MQCLIWNVEWAGPRSKRGKLIREQIDAIDPDVACYTEVVEGSCPRGNVIAPLDDYGYPNQNGRKKVLLWSKEPWDQVDYGHPNLPSGRFISGIVAGIRFVGVCIPWKDAHVRTGRRDRSPWQDHLTYCEVLKSILHHYTQESIPVCLLGDFNQRIPRLSQPLGVAHALINAIPVDYRIVAENIRDSEGKLLIDHLVLSSSLTPSNLSVIPRHALDGTHLSDHVGVRARLERKTP